MLTVTQTWLCGLMALDTVRAIERPTVPETAELEEVPMDPPTNATFV
jgi:hypothetical protein